MNRKLKINALAIFVSLAFIGCTSSIGSQDTSLANSKLERDLNPSVSQTQLRELANENNAFAFDMFTELRTSESGNVFFSPYSISEALVMTCAGAKGDTKTQMSDVLHFNTDKTSLHNAFNALDLHLNYSDNNYTFSVANSLWAQKDYKFLDSYLDTIKVHYGADVRLLNFAESEKSSTTINAWVEDKTHQKIKDLIPVGILSSDTRLVLTNAVYFKGQWVHNFKEIATQKDTFHLLDGSTKQTLLMQQTERFLYANDKNYQAINLPYKGDRTSMLVVLPRDGKFETVVSDIKNVYQESLHNMTSSRVHLKMPKFEFTTDVYKLNKYFKELGMIDAFAHAADFSGMTGLRDLYIEAILHKAFIKVDEKGTQAAAATAVVMNYKSIPVNPITMSIDRPFIFFIKDDKSGQVLFMGIVKEPKV